MKTTITPLVTMVFQGAKTGQRYTLPEGVTVQIDPEELAHLDPSDYVSGPRPEGVSSEGERDARFAEQFQKLQWVKVKRGSDY